MLVTPVLLIVDKNQQKIVTLSMDNGVSLQPGRAGDIVDKKVNKIFQGIFVYNTVMNVSDVQTANRVLHLI